MRYLFAAIIFCGVGVAGAQELPSANFAPVALSEQRTQVWRVYNLNPDCTPADAIVGKVTKQGKGQVEFEENLGFSTYPPNTQKSRCNAQQTAGLSLFYTSPAGFRVNWPPFRPDSRHNLEGLRLSSSTGLCLTTIDASN